MKGNKLVIAVILALIVCLVLIPTCAFADEAVPDAQTDGQQQTEQTYEQSNAVAPDTSDAAVTEKDDSSDNDEGKNLPDSGDKEAGNTASGDNSSNDQSVDGDDTKGEEPKGNETEESKVVEEGTSGAENVPLQPEEPKYTVEFGENKEFVLNGGESAKLSDVLGALGITGEISSAASSDDSLFSVKQDEKGEWSVTAENCFSSEQRMTVVVNGQTYEIVVTDAGVVAKNITANKEYTSLQNAINEAGENAVIQLSDNVTESVIIASGKTITIDLNGWTLKNDRTKPNSDGFSHTIFNKGTLTVIDSSADKTGTVLVESGNVSGVALANVGKATLSGGTFRRDEDQPYVVRNFGDMTINEGATIYKETIWGAAVTNGWNHGNKVTKDDYYIAPKDNTARLTINGGTIDGSWMNVKNDDYGYLVINGGNFVNSSSQVIGNFNVAEINGGNFYAQNCRGQINKDGTRPDASTTIFIDNCGGNDMSNKGILTIRGGNFIVKDGLSVIAVKTRNGGFNGSNLTITGGSIDGTIGDNAADNKNITGGIYTDENVNALVDEDTVIVESNGKYAVGKSGYDLAKDGETVTVIKAPAKAPIDDVPAGVTVVNDTDDSIFINGIEVKPGETIVTIAQTKTTSTTATTASDQLYAKYLVLEGKGQQWTDGDLEFVLNSNAVVKVLIDGVEVEFTVAEDGTVTIASAVIEALEAGTHEIQFIFADGSCMTTFTK